MEMPNVGTDEDFARVEFGAPKNAILTLPERSC